MPEILRAAPARVWNYGRIVAAIRPSALVCYHPLADGSGAAALDRGTHAVPLTYRSSPVLGNDLGALVAAQMSGTTSDALYTAANLASAGFSFAEGAIAFWCKTTPTLWDEATTRRPVLLQVDTSNRIFIQKTGGADTLQFTYQGGGTSKNYSHLYATMKASGLLHVCFVWSKAGDSIKTYIQGDLVDTSTGLPTIVGTVATPILNGNPYWPSAYMAQVAIWNAPLTATEVKALADGVRLDRLIACDGDSLTAGRQLAATPYPQQMLRGLTASDTILYNLGVSGQKLTDMLADYATEVAPLYKRGGYGKRVLCVGGGTNDLYNEATALAIARRAAYCAMARATGWDVVQLTVTPAAGAGYPVGYNTEVATFNTAVKADAALYGDGVADVAAATNLSDPTNTTYYNADKVHLTTAGYGEMATVVKAAVLAR